MWQSNNVHKNMSKVFKFCLFGITASSPVLRWQQRRVQLNSNVMIVVPRVSNILLDSLMATLKIQTAVLKCKCPGISFRYHIHVILFGGKTSDWIFCLTDIMEIISFALRWKETRIKRCNVCVYIFNWSHSQGEENLVWKHQIMITLKAKKGV